MKEFSVSRWKLVKKTHNYLVEGLVLRLCRLKLNPGYFFCFLAERKLDRAAINNLEYGKKGMKIHTINCESRAILIQ